MSLGCGEGRETIYGAFVLIYELGRKKEGFVFHDKKKDIVPPNSAVCLEHLARLPEGFIRTDADDVPDDMELYGIANATSGTTPFGAAQWSSLESDDATMRYVSRDVMTRYLPRALEIIDGDALDKQASKTVRQVYAYTKSAKICLKEMTTFSPSVVCVHDESNEWDVYFNASRCVVAHPEIWGKDCKILFPKSLKDVDFGVLQGASSRRITKGRIKDATTRAGIESFEDAFEFAKRNLNLKGRETWNKAPWKVPKYWFE